MSITHTAQIYTEMLNDTKFRHAVASKPVEAFHGWELSKKEHELLVEDAKAGSEKFSPSTSKVLNYLIANQPFGEPVGAALGNAIGRQLGLKVIGPRSAGCDGGCCGWTGRVMFAGDPERIARLERSSG
jgi:hypothetical protein